MNIKLFDSERRVMNVLWEKGNLSAGQLAKILKQEIGWNRNTTYTVIKKCINKGAIKRYEPNFMCEAIISKEQVGEYETNELIKKMFDGSTEKFFASFLGNSNLSNEEIKKLKKLIEELK
ncbi:BlaI/MecI/CopY family transcriptional regulator [Clostridiaceae bacterium M8S5]|nr:BlaI/MecI/CopY family transcriptional regulator [Clostridiaceae bacterium M8S5]